MKAVIHTEYGPPDVLRLAEVPTPAPKDNEILIRVLARPVGYGDLTARDFAHLPLSEFNMPAPIWLIARIAFGLRKPRKPILGAEFAGVVVSMGPAATRFKVGDAVYGFRGENFGTNAEYLCMPETGLVAEKPANLSFEQACAVPYGALMAMNLLKKTPIQPGHKVLIVGASGGIGSAAVQLAKHYGAEVTGVCGTPRLELVRALGADHVIDYTREDFTQNGQTYDLIFDVLGRTSFGRCKHSLTPDGRYLRASFKIPHLFQMLRTSVIGSKKVICAISSGSVEDLRAIKALTEQGAFTAIVDRCFPLEQTADAHRYAEAGHKTGAIVITSPEAGIP